ncbi:hypothetical protein V8C42DRAFT_311567 [Trichoderma barbatum]
MQLSAYGIWRLLTACYSILFLFIRSEGEKEERGGSFAPVRFRLLQGSISEPLGTVRLLASVRECDCSEKDRQDTNGTGPRHSSLQYAELGDDTCILKSLFAGRNAQAAVAPGMSNSSQYQGRCDLVETRADIGD